MNKEALTYNSSILDKFHTICGTLFVNSCISSFRYFRVFDDGSFINLSSDHNWLVDRIEKIPNNGNCFHKPLCDATEDKATFYLWDNNAKDPVLDLMKAYNISNGISAYKRKGSSVEAWSFGATNQDTFAGNFYINNMEFLKSFINHFNIAGAQLVDSAKRAFFTDSAMVKPFKNDNESINSFALNPFGSKNIHLSQREFQCLKLISKGRTAKEIAIDLHISPRTVETYIHSIKTKLGVNTKSQASDFFWQHCMEMHNVETRQMLGA